MKLRSYFSREYRRFRKEYNIGTWLHFNVNFFFKLGLKNIWTLETDSNSPFRNKRTKILIKIYFISSHKVAFQDVSYFIFAIGLMIIELTSCVHFCFGLYLRKIWLLSAVYCFSFCGIKSVDPNERTELEIQFEF